MRDRTVGTPGDRLRFDGEYRLRGTGGRFRIDRIIPASGRAGIVGTTGEGGTRRDATMNIDEVRTRIRSV